MSTQSQPANESELVTFLEKLGQFHSTLSPREQAILNEITVAAVTAGGDVQGYIGAPTIRTVFLASPETGGTVAAYYYKYYNSVAGALQAGGLQAGGGSIQAQPLV